MVSALESQIASRTESQTGHPAGHQKEAALEREALRRRRALMVGASVPMGADRRICLQAASLRNAGLSVSVLAPEGESRVSIGPGLAGIRHLSCTPMQVLPEEGVARRAARAEIIAIAAAILKESFRAPGFSLLTIAQPASIALPAVRLARLLGKAIVLDYRIPAPEAVLEEGAVEDSEAYQAALKTEEKLLHAADLVLCPTEAMKSALDTRSSVPRDKLVVVPSGLASCNASAAVKTRFARPRRYLVAYSGPLTAHSGADLFIRASRRVVYGLERTDIQFVLAGSGPYAEAMRNLAIAEGLKDHVTCLPGDDPALVASVLSEADLAVDTTPDSRLGELIASAPLLEYASHGVPVVAFRRTETTQNGHSVFNAVRRGIPELARGILDALAQHPRAMAPGEPAPLWAEQGEPAFVAAIQALLGLEIPQAAPAMADAG